MDLRTVQLCVSLCVCLFVRVSSTTERTITEDTDFDDSKDVVMKEDAEEVFYNVNLEKYDELGVHCPRPEPPEHGHIKGEDTRVGSVVYVVCQTGFRLEGPTVMACIPAGKRAQWDPVHGRKCVEGGQHFEETDETPDEMLSARQTVRDHQQLHVELPEEPPYLDTRLQQSWMNRPRKERLPEHVPEEERGDYESNLTEELGQTPSFCFQSPDTGPCKALIHRFYFDKQAGECRHFVYGGCLGNNNNFETLEDCNSICLGHQ